MSTNQDNRFDFRHSAHLPGLTVLNATMRDFSYEKHAHEEYSLGVTLAGLQDFSCKGAFYRSVPGNVILFDPEDVHDGHPGSPVALEYVMLYIRADELAPLLDAAGDHPHAGLVRFSETLIQDPQLGAHVLALAELIGSRNGSRLEEEEQLYSIAAHLARRAGRCQPEQWIGEQDSLLLRVRDYIHDNPAEDLGLDDLAEVAGLSKFQLIRLFRRQFGITPHRYVLNCRVNGARAALENGVPPTDAAQMFAFADASHLNRQFKRCYGLTPGQYQLQASR